MATFYKTIESAKEANLGNYEALYVVEVEPTIPDSGRYIVIKCHIKSLIAGLRQKPHPEIKSIIGAVCDLAEIRAKAKSQQMANLFPGLAEIRAAREDEMRYQEQFNEMMEDENNDGAMPPRPIKTKSSELLAKYPAAAAYLHAEDFSLSSHFAKVAAGKRAIDRLMAGKDYKSIIEKMENEWTEYCNEHVWD
jgi:hypothetical protein